MNNYIITPKSSITAIADAIRLAGGGTEGLSLAQMPDEISNLKPQYETYKVTFNNDEGTISSPDDCHVIGAFVKNNGELSFEEILAPRETTILNVIKDTKIAIFISGNGHDGLMETTYEKASLVGNKRNEKCIFSIDENDAIINIKGAF